MAKENLQPSLNFNLRDRVWCAAYANLPHHPWMITCDSGKRMCIWSLDSGKCLVELEEVHGRTIRSVAFSPRDDMIAACGFDGIVSIWKQRDPSGDDRLHLYEHLTSLEGHENEVKCVAWSKDGHYLATCGRDKSVWLWDTLGGEGDFECAAVLQEHSQDVKNVVWNFEKNWLFSSSYDNTIKLWQDQWDDGDWICSQTLSGHLSTVWSVACLTSSNGDDLLASVSEDGQLKCWKLIGAVYECISTYQSPEHDPIYSVTWCPMYSSSNDQKVEPHDSSLWLATAGSDNSISIFQLQSTTNHHDLIKVKCFPNSHDADINSIQWHPQRKCLLTASDDCTARTWSFSSHFPHIN